MHFPLTGNTVNNSTAVQKLKVSEGTTSSESTNASLDIFVKRPISEFLSELKKRVDLY